MPSPLPRIFGCDLELLIATEVLRLRSLHYGFWETPPAPVNLGAIRDAQARFSVELMKFIPAHAKSVLDVGAGIGDNAQLLARRGMKVTAISPDRNHARYYRRLRAQGIRYIRTRFEDLDLAERFDLIFMCESLNYFDREIGIQQCRSYLKPAGHLLIAAMFQRPEQRPFPPAFSADDLPYVALARKEGFALLASRDVTQHVLPTMDYAHMSLQRYVFPFLQPFSPDSLAGHWLRKTPFRRIARSIHDIRTFYEHRTKSEYFRRHIRYMFLLLRRLP